MAERGIVMKGLWSVLLCFLLVGLLCGCGDSASVPTEPMNTPVTQPAEMPEPTYPVDESVFYFSNDLEASRLYSQRLDGTDLKLVMDTYCYAVRQVGESVYYLDGKNLNVYHISTNQSSVLITDVIDYAVEDDHLVYYLDGKEPFEVELHIMNLQTGEDEKIESFFNGGSCDMKDGILYYTRYDELQGKNELCVCDLETLEITTIAKKLTSFYLLKAVKGGVYFEGIDEGYTFAQYYASADGSVLQRMDDLIPECQMFRKTEDGTYCVFSTYEETGITCCIHRHNPDGSITDLLWGEEGEYFTIDPLSEDRWLVMHTSFDHWIPVDAKEDESYFVNKVEYLLMDAEGNITPINAVGELGNMFSAGDFPVIDSSTARKPITADLYTAFVAKFGYEGAKPLCSTTHGAWLNIADRKADIALLAAPTEEEMDYLNQRGVGIEMKLYGGDGLVFIGNAANPVQNLSHEQIIAIYQGKITNWSEVGGPDEPIIVYYRDDQSGSQRLFEKMVFKGLEPPKYEELGFWYMDEMSTIVDIVIDDPYAIGYSIMTYLDDVYSNKELKVFAVNGVAPSVDTVKDSSYPYHTQGYVVIRSDEPEGSSARRLFDWFGCPVSDEMLIANGITPLHGDNGIG